MTSRNDYVVYAPLPPNPKTTAHNVVVLPLYHPPPSKRRRICQFLTSFTAFLLVSLTVYFLYPSDPTVQLVRLRLNNIEVKSFPQLTLDLSFSLTVKVRNRDLFSFDYHSMAVSVGYRGRELGIVSSDGGRVRARGSSYVNATLDLNGFEVIHDVFYLLEDLAKGVIPFDTVTEVKWSIRVLLLQYSSQGKIILRGVCKYKQPDNCPPRLLPGVMEWMPVDFSMTSWELNILKGLGT